MSIDFSTLQGLTIPEGVVTQITDASGRVLWEKVSNIPAVLQVEKITATTYVGETSYSDENFILFDIYPKTNGTVSVTYGGLTKTITDTSGAEKPNAQQVFFGTFNGVTDSVTTPASGTLTIEGDYYAFGCGSYKSGSKDLYTARCACVTAINDFGHISIIIGGAFNGCTGITSVTIPNSVTEIKASAFNGCTALTNVSMPDTIASIGDYAFNECTALALTSLSSALTTIGTKAFYNCTALALTSLPSGITSIGESAFYGCANMTISELPSGLTSIAQGTFQSCKKITVKSLPSGVTSIGGWGFQGCKLIPSMAIPSGVTSIGKNALQGCAALTSVTFENTSGWYVTKTVNATSGTNVDVTNATNNVTLLTDTYGKDYFWYRS